MEERDEYTESRPINNSEAVQEANACVEVDVLTCLSNEQMHSVPDYQESETTPDYTHPSGSVEEKPWVQQNMEEGNEEKPWVQQNMEEGNEEKPWVQQNMKEGNEEKPGVQQNMEVGNEEKPGVQHNMEEGNEEKPGVQQNMEEGNEEKPGVQQNMEEKNEEKPGVQHNMEEENEEKSRVQQNMEEENEEKSGVQQNMEEENEEKSGVQQNMEEENEEKSGVQQNMEEENEEKPGVQQNMEEENEEKLGVQQNMEEENEEKPEVQQNMEEENKHNMEEENKHNMEEENNQNMDDENNQNVEEENNKELGLGDALSELSEKSNQVISNLDYKDEVEAGNLLSSDKDTEHLVLPIEIETMTLLNECSEPPTKDDNKNYIQQMNPPIEDLTQNTSIQNLEMVPSSSRQLDHKDKRILKSRKKNMLKSHVRTDRVLRSRTQEKSKDSEPSNDLNNSTAGEEGKRKKKKKSKDSEPSNDLNNSTAGEEGKRKKKKKSKDSEPSNDLNNSTAREEGKRKKKKKSKDSAPSNDLNNSTAGDVGKRKNKKRSIKGEGARVDEFSSIRKHLRYLMNRISYEQSLIEAYSSEGWKGFSSDKLKPEKELQRASNEIMRRKLKIRDLFQRIDSLCAEGRFSESLFDSEGQIDSEDIFCAKCGSDELSLENDIILCDGVCDRGFHQFCLEPPLLKSDIPPDDEGWLCPGCDCKDDCMDLLNEFQGSNLSITDGWEKVYPEAAAAAGQSSDHTLGLPSDDSEDGDYDPDVPDVPDAIDQDDGSSSEESSSDQSGYASASEVLEAPPNEDQYLGLPSDDSEDDDYDPSAPERVEGVGQESSSSDFTSDSEDLAAFGDNGSSKDDKLVSSPINNTVPVRNSNGQSSDCGPSKSALHNESSSLLESGLDMDGLEPVSGRRHVERLDYKKLHDEAYGNVPSDSSDETYGSDSMDTSDDRGRGGSTRKRSSKNLVPALSKNGTNNLNTIKTKRSSKRTCQKLVAENMDSPVAKTPDNTMKSSSSVRRTTSSNRRLGQPALERLLASFQENQYPDRATKESLAEELGLNSKQVSKWFENTRWSTRHPSSEANKAKSASRMGIQSSHSSGKIPKHEQESGACFRDTDSNGAQHQESPKPISVVAPCQSGDMGEDKLANLKTKRPESTSAKSRKRKGRSDHVACRSKEKKESQKPPAKSRKVNEIQTEDKARTRRRRSI